MVGSARNGRPTKSRACRPGPHWSDAPCQPELERDLAGAQYLTDELQWISTPGQSELSPLKEITEGPPFVMTASAPGARPDDDGREIDLLKLVDGSENSQTTRAMSMAAHDRRMVITGRRVQDFLDIHSRHAVGAVSISITNELA